MAKIDAAQLLRLKLARQFLHNVNHASGSIYDGYQYSAKIVSMHDCIDNLLGAVMGHEDIEIGREKDYLLARHLRVASSYTKLQKYKADIKLLNSLRNGIKHEGLLPNEKQVPPLLDRLREYVELTCEEVFELNINNISMSHLIVDDDHRNAAQNIEEQIRKRNYRKAMELAATLLFESIESRATFSLGALHRMLNPPDNPDDPIFIQSLDSSSISKYVFESGVDPHLYYRVKKLLLDVGYESHKSDKLIYKEDPSYWHDANWTEQNASFCIDTIVEIVLSNQKDYSSLFTLTTKIHNPMYFNVTILHETNLLKSATDVSKSNVVSTLTKGDEILCWVKGYIDGRWLDYYGHTDLYAKVTVMTEDGKRIRYKEHDTYVLKKDINIAESTLEYFT